MSGQALHGVAAGPPPERRCSATKANGEQCGAWAAKGTGGLCAGHARLSSTKKRASKEVEAELAAAVALSEAQAELAQAQGALGASNPFEPESAAALRQARDEARRKVEEAADRLRMERVAPAQLDTPTRTAEMERAGLHWVRVYDAVEHVARNAVKDEQGHWFTWQMRDQQALRGNRRAGLVDPDVERLGVERAEARDAAVEDDRQREMAELTARWAEVTNSGYALAYRAGERGMTPEAYLDWLDWRLDELFGHEVDIDGDPSEDWESVIKPTLAREARRRAWSTITSMR